MAASVIAQDLTVTSFNVTVVQGEPITFYATLPTGITSTHYKWYLGDGTVATTKSGVETHTYSAAGTYAVYVTATDTKGVDHTNGHGILYVAVTSSFTGDTNGNFVQFAGSVESNSTSTSGATTVLRPGDSATVSASVISGPEDELSAYGTPAFVLGASVGTNATLSAETLHAAGKSTVTVTFAKTIPFGLYTLVYADPTLTPVNGSTVTAWNNYTFTFVVGKGYEGTGLPVETSPHPGVLVADEYTGDLLTIDPAAGYGGTGSELVSNVYQTLVAPNGTVAGPDTADYNPDLAVCVPGSAQCTTLFGKSLIAGAGTDYTFAINPAARFFDNATGTFFDVYPSDVMFSVARLLAYANLPGVEFYPGWILAQALLPLGNGSWDGGIHAPYNNTPQSILDSMYVNDSAYCPASAMTLDHGCITFIADGDGHAWPFLLAALGTSWGASIAPCGWFSAKSQGAGLPGWPGPPGNGDRPCLLPGKSNTTSSASFRKAVAAMSPTSWDAYEEQGSSDYPSPVPGVQWKAVGSGAYYVVSANASTGYELKTNPAFEPNPYCTWSTCEGPTASQYSEVVVHLIASASTAAGDLAAGRVDLTSFPEDNLSLVDDLVASGQASFDIEPTLNILTPVLALEYSPGSAKALFGRSFTAPSDFLTYVGLRQFLVESYPTAAVEAAEGISGGISAFFPAGGAIPQRMGDYYPTNISWPLTTPDSDPADVGGAAWWWSEATNPASPAFDPELSGCTSKKPCTFPMAYLEGSINTDGFPLWAASVVKLSGGAVKPFAEAVNFSAYVQFLFADPGTNPTGVWDSSWVPDYADPSDYVAPFYLPNATYSFPDAVEQALAPLTSAGCSSLVTYWSSLATPIPESCQGAAYNAMVSALSAAKYASLGAGRVLLYNEAEHIARALALYGPDQQTTDLKVFAPWISSASLSESLLYASGALNLWYEVRATGLAATPLSLRGIVAEPNPVTLDSLVTLYSLATGGTGGYVYAYSINDSAVVCPTSPNATAHCIALNTGTALINVTVTDATGQQLTSAAIVVTVNQVKRTRSRRTDPVPR
ncbi:MAG TPA: PKD domain-containing protein [Thermoplasmata archaeon]|nr:PKD domain-containing protein [Thermoplasmata archaeon]